ncbi:MAG: tRNA lysidine(34) synthetase TilS [Chloroflexi bacterium]|nr:tRNA lysidine(34) synthetase TilS [Chloroflexota bacterium]
MGLDRADKRLWTTVLHTLRPFPFNSPQTKIIVGVSGGVDSLALLHLLWRQLGAARLLVAHVHHGLREEATADAQFVRETAVSWQIPYVIEKSDVAQVAKQSRLSLEAAGRQVRYRFFSRQARRCGATAVAVAHHADDQAETVLLNLLRGSGTLGLRGMLPLSNVPGTDDLPLLRPFLNISRSTLEAYCAKHNLQPRHDSSNDDIQFARNRIRQELLPLLKTYNPQINARLQQLANVSGADYATLTAVFDEIFPNIVAQRGDGWLILHRAEFKELALAWQRLALRRAVQQLRPLQSETGFQTIEQARELILGSGSGTEATLPGQLTMRIEAAQIIFGAERDPFSKTFPQVMTDSPLELTIPGKVLLADGWHITAVTQPNTPLQTIRQNKNVWQAFVDVAEAEQLWIRPSLPNERFQPLGLAGHSQPIQDLLTNRKVMREKRPLWPIIATAQHPVWIVGQHLDERVRVSNTSRRIIHLTCTQK